MKLKQIFNMKNILSFIEGNYKFYYDKMIGMPLYIQEQVLWRMELCKDDCVPNGKCIYCNCSTYKKVFVKESCNNGERFPDMMDEKDWKQYKKDNKIKMK